MNNTQTQQCESNNHTHCYGDLWQCNLCGRTVCANEGADDKYFHLCDDCAQAQHRLEDVKEDIETIRNNMRTYKDARNSNWHAVNVKRRDDYTELVEEQDVFGADEIERMYWNDFLQSGWNEINRRVNDSIYTKYLKLQQAQGTNRPALYVIPKGRSGGHACFQLKHTLRDRRRWMQRIKEDWKQAKESGDQEYAQRRAEDLAEAIKATRRAIKEIDRVKEIIEDVNKSLDWHDYLETELQRHKRQGGEHSKI